MACSGNGFGSGSGKGPLIIKNQNREPKTKKEAATMAILASIFLKESGFLGLDFGIKASMTEGTGVFSSF